MIDHLNNIKNNFFLYVFIINVTNAIFLLTFLSLLNNEFLFNIIKSYEFFFDEFSNIVCRLIFAI